MLRLRTVYRPLVSRLTSIVPCLAHARLLSTVADSVESAPVASVDASVSHAPVTFDALGLGQHLVKRVVRLKFDQPTLIQQLSIPTILSNHDTIIAAETGAGKTMAYLLPLVNRLLNTPPTHPLPPSELVDRDDIGKWPRALIVVPTRELCAQVLGMCEPLLRGTHVRAATMTGQQNLRDLFSTDAAAAAPTTTSTMLSSSRPQRSRPEIAITTPGCLARALCVDGQSLNSRGGRNGRAARDARLLVAHTAFVVFDEADLLWTAAQTQMEAIVMPFRQRDKAVRRALRDESTATEHPTGSELGQPTQWIFAAATLPQEATRAVAGLIQKLFPQAKMIRTPHLHHLNPLVRHEFVMLSSTTPSVVSGPLVTTLQEAANTMSGSPDTVEDVSGGGSTSFPALLLKQMIHPTALTEQEKAVVVQTRAAIHKRIEEVPTESESPAETTETFSSFPAAQSTTAETPSWVAASEKAWQKRAEFVQSEYKNKIETLQRIIQDEMRNASTDRPARILVFCNTATTAECVQLSLSQSKQNVGVLAVACHKNVPHLNRAQNFLRFQQGGIPVLISTDLASRGIDFRGVTRVVQFDFATNIVDLIHRVGRTARSGLPGAVTSFVTQHNASMLRAVYKHLLQQVSEESAEPSALEKVFSRNRGLRRRDRRAAARATEDQHEEPTKPTTAPQIPL